MEGNGEQSFKQFKKNDKVVLTSDNKEVKHFWYLLTQNSCWILPEASVFPAYSSAGETMLVV